MIFSSFRIGFLGLTRAKHEARQAISILESQLKFLDHSDCFQAKKANIRQDFHCSTSTIDRSTLTRLAEEELIYLENFSSEQATVEVIALSINYLPSIIRSYIVP